MLIALLPFHALLVTVLTRVIAGPGHAPLPLLAFWKEGLLAFILLIAGIEFLRSQRLPATSYKLQADVLDLMILALVVLSVIVTFFTHRNWTLYLFGFRYDFVPLIAFLVLRRVEWSDAFVLWAKRIILPVAEIITVYGIVSFFLPQSFFTWLGYSDLHSLYVPGGPVAPFQLIGETGLRRIQSVMSGPNQFGIWLLIPIAIRLTELTRARLPSPVFGRTDEHRLFWKIVFNLSLYGIALVLTFSRAAWIGALVIACVVIAPIMRHLPRRMLLGAGALLAIAVIAVAALFPSVIVRLSSTRGHFTGPVQAIQSMVNEPFGQGMGMAGPASNRVSDTCVYLQETDDPSWAADRPDLCVFLGQTQVQPTDRTCTCPFLPENWYLQIGVELGWLGFVLYLGVMSMVFYQLSVISYQSSVISYQSSGGGARVTSILQVRSALIGISIVALFLHAFEDAATAYTVWILCAVCIGSVRLTALLRADH